MPAKKRIDWEKVKADYRKGTKTNVQLAYKYDCTEGSIRKMVKRNGWKKDLKKPIAKRVKQKLRAKAKKKKIAKKKAKRVVKDPQITPEREEEIVEAAANRAVMIVQAHRGDMMQMRMVIHDMLQELSVLSQDPSKLIGAIDVVTHQGELSIDKADSARKQLLKILDLPMRTASIRNLAKALTTLIPLERQAYGLNDDEKPPEEDYTPMAERIKRHARDLDKLTGPPQLKVVGGKE